MTSNLKFLGHTDLLRALTQSGGAASEVFQLCTSFRGRLIPKIAT